MTAATIAECDALLQRGGWEVDDARDYLRENPGAFAFPSQDTLSALRAGSSIQAIFSVIDLADFSRDGVAPWDEQERPNLTRGHERIWCWVQKVGPASLEVVVMNTPYATFTRLCLGARVTLRTADIIDVVLTPPVRMEEELAAMRLVTEDELRRPLSREDPPRIAPEQAEVCRRFGVKPQRPFALSGMLLSQAIGPDTVMLYGTRARPRHTERCDCGWVIWTGHPDMDDAHRMHPLKVTHVEHAYDLAPRAARYLALPPGWGFVLGPDGYEDVYEVPEALR